MMIAVAYLLLNRETKIGVLEEELKELKRTNASEARIISAENRLISAEAIFNNLVTERRELRAQLAAQAGI